MQSVVTYIRSLLGWNDEIPTERLSFKRDRGDEGFSSEDDTPAFKRPKQLMKTVFPTTMSTNSNTNGWGTEEKRSNIRYVPIQLESGYPSIPSTSTPMESAAKHEARARTVPIQLVGVRDKRLNSPIRKPTNHNPIVHAIIDDDDVDQEVKIVAVKPDIKRKPKYYVDLDDYEDYPNQTDDDDVIFVKKVTTPPPIKPYKYFISNDNQDDAEKPIYYKLTRKANDRSTMSPRSYSKFIAPPGITKSYKKAPTPLPKWMQASKPQNLTRNKYLGMNGNTRTTLNEVFNLDEKKNYQELIKKVASSMKSNYGKPSQIFNLAEEMASFRNTQRVQKKSLHEINLLQKGLIAEKENNATTEYDPITVASLNSSDSEIEIVPSDTSTSSSVKIDPVNTLRDSYKDKAITSGDWLSKLDTKYRKKRLETQVKVKDAKRESDIISKVNSEQRIAQLEHKLKHELSIPESLLEEPQATVELPPLTPEQEKLVNRALGPGPPGQLLVEKFGLRIHRRDLQTLSGLNWLNDEVINFYMNLLMQRSEERKDLPKVYAANTFFYPKLMQSGQAGLRRWTRKVDIFAHDLMVIPVHLGVHWCVSIIDFRAKKINYLDSMGGRNQACLEALLAYLRDEHRDKKGAPLDDQGWKTECLKDIPQQMNGSDCGMFSCTFAEFSARDAPYTFTQAHMPYLRRKAALEILSGKLLL